MKKRWFLLLNAYYSDVDEKNYSSKSYTRRRNYDDYDGYDYDENDYMNENYSYYSSSTNKNLYGDEENDYIDDYAEETNVDFIKEEYNYEEDKDYYASDELNGNELETDDDLADYFADARIFSTKKKTIKAKKRPKKQIYKADEKIIVSMNKEKNSGIILFGPYDVNKKQMYQIELDDGSIIEADDKHIAYQ